MRTQGSRLKLETNFSGSLESIFTLLSQLKSAASADLVSVGDSWLSYAIKKGLIEPISGVEDQDWFKSLSDKWKVDF